MKFLAKAQRTQRKALLVWESLSATPEAIPLTNAQRTELDRHELDHEIPTRIPWEEALHRIRRRSL